MADAPTLPLFPRTLLFDRVRNMQVGWIEGIVPLPIGAEVELINPNVTAFVVGVRLSNGPHDAALTYDLKVPASWWSARGML